MTPRAAYLGLFASIVASCAGCNIVGPAVLLLHPPIKEPAEVELTEGRLALLVEYARSREENPVFTRAFHDRLQEVLREQKLPTTFISQDEVARARRAHPDFARWNLQQIGRELDADQVLYARVEQLRLRDDAVGLIVTPEVQLRLMLIDVHARDKPRLWPDETEGRLVKRGRPSQEATDPVMVDAETTKLARDTAWVVAKYFYEYDVEEKDPWEP